MAYDEYGNYYVEGDYREEPGFWSRVGSGIASGARSLASGTGKFVTSFVNDLPNLYNNFDNWTANKFNYQLRPEDERVWYNRYEPIPQEREPFTWRGFGRDVASEIPMAISLGLGVPGGATAGALRSVKPFGRRLLRTGVSYAWNRGLPVSFWSDAFEQGDYAAAVADTNAFLAGNLGGRFINRLPVFLGGGRVRNLAKGASVLGGALGLTYGGYLATKPLENALGGNIDRIPALEGKRFGNNIFRNGVLVYEPLPGVDPYYDYMHRGNR